MLAQLNSNPLSGNHEAQELVFHAFVLAALFKEILHTSEKREFGRKKPTGGKSARKKLRRPD